MSEQERQRLRAQSLRMGVHPERVDLWISAAEEAALEAEADFRAASEEAYQQLCNFLFEHLGPFEIESEDLLRETVDVVCARDGNIDEFATVLLGQIRTS